MTTINIISLICVIGFLSVYSGHKLPPSATERELAKQSIITQPDVTTVTKDTIRKTENDRPIIGILTQEIGRFIDTRYPGHNYKSYIAASYVKFVEGAGARAVPIWIGQPRSYYENILGKINGVLLPGGATYFNQTNGYASAGEHIFDIVMKLNMNGNFMPIWGTCLGFELLTYLSANSTEHRNVCHSTSQPLPLEFKPDFRDSRLFGKAPENILEILQKENVTSNFHTFCVTEKKLKKMGLDKEWKVLSTNHDWRNFKFISTIEHKNFPFYGVQFHPEKNLYEFIRNRNITHTLNAIKVSQYFANFFVNETRKNFNSFDTIQEESKHLMYNYVPEFTGAKGSAFQQIYMFNQENNIRESNQFNRPDVEKSVNLVEHQNFES